MAPNRSQAPIPTSDSFNTSEKENVSSKFHGPKDKSHARNPQSNSVRKENPYNLPARKEEQRTPESPRPRPEAGTTQPSNTVDELCDGTVLIWPSGDALLEFQRDESSDDICTFRVDSARLAGCSPYFKRLFEDTRFSEAVEFDRKRRHIRQHYSNPADAPCEALPRLTIIDMGALSINKTIKPLLTDFLLVLHGLDTVARRIPIGNLANLAVVADRFDCTAQVAHWARNRGHLASTLSTKNEETIRQRLLVGLLLGHGEWVQSNSKDLIIGGSVRWIESDSEPPGLSLAMWWDLPKNVEEELRYRRGRVVESLWSLPSSLLKAYTSGSRQCRLGYDSSPQCDSFQLGEYIRFLAKNGLVNFQSPIMEGRHPRYPRNKEAKDIITMISVLRQCPAYQVDSNHSHCGPRKMLMNGLDLIQRLLTERGIGICNECWNSKTPQNPPWTAARKPLVWNLTSWRDLGRMLPKHTEGYGDGEHYSGREFFMATEKIWNFESAT